MPATVDDTKRIGKLVPIVALFLAATCITLIINTPPSVGSHLLLLAARTAAVYLSLFMGIGLSMFSIITPPSPGAVWVQKTVMVIALGFLTLAFIFHTSLVLPAVYFALVWLLFVTVVAAIILSLYISSTVPAPPESS